MRPYFHLIPFAVLFFAIGMLLEYRKHRSDSRYFYPLAVGMLFLAIGLIRLQQDLFREAAWWPLGLLLLGMLLMLGAAHYSWLRMTLRRLLRRD